MKERRPASRDLTWLDGSTDPTDQLLDAQFLPVSVPTRCQQQQEAYGHEKEHLSHAEPTEVDPILVHSIAALRSRLITSQRARSKVSKKLLGSDLHVPDDLAKQDGRDISAAVDRDGCAATVRMRELLVRAALPGLGEAERHQNRDHLTRLEDREARHLRRDRLDPYEFGFQLGFAVLEEHRHYLSKVLGQLRTGLSLRVGTGETGHMADEEAGLSVFFNDGGELSHSPCAWGS